MPPTGSLIWLCILFLGAIVLLSVVALSAVPLADTLADTVLMKKTSKDGYQSSPTAQYGLVTKSYKLRRSTDFFGIF
jgi:hypothetical protein